MTQDNTKKPTGPTAVALFEAIQQFFKEAKPAEAQQAWDALCGLRGPDRDDEAGLKDATTGVIRWHLVGASIGDLAIAGPDMLILAEQRRKAHPDSRFPRDTHFLRHTQDAFAALGLRFDKYNEEYDE